MESMDISSVLLYMNSCSQCQMAKNSGVESFIAHLASVHSIPTEWPSDRAARLTGAEAKKPYTTVAATRKKRRKLTTPRPLNSFMIFAQHIRRNVLAIFDTASSSNVSRLLGEAWNSIPKEVRAAYDEEAARLSKIHNIEFPTYKYQPKPRHWQQSNVAASPFNHNSESPPTQVLQTPSTSLSVPCPTSPTLLSISIPSASTSAERPSSPLVVKMEPLSPASSSSSHLLSSSSCRLKLPIPDIRPPPPTKRPSKLIKIAPATPTSTITPRQSAAKLDFEHDRSSPCLSTSSPPSRTPSPLQQLTPSQEDIGPPSSSTQASETMTAQQRVAANLATLHKLINQATASSQQQQQIQHQLQQLHQAELALEQNSSKPCILLTPIQSDIGQQAIISCGQSATVPTLLTCGNTIYVVLTVLQSPANQNPGVRTQATQSVEVVTPQRQSVVNLEGLLGSNLVDSMCSLDANQVRLSADCRLAELLQAAVSAAGTTATTTQ